LHAPIRWWYVIERISFLLIVWAWLTRDRSRRYDLVNFIVAYPNATSVRWLRWMFGVPVTITEHWTAYHFSFRSNAKGLDRIRRIFHHRVPVIVVSQVLADDIARFSGARDIPFHIVDNVVDPEVFHRDPEVTPEPGRFFAIFGLRPPKRPEVLIEAMARLRAQGRKVKLRIAGYGPMKEELERLITQLGLEGTVELLGGVDAPTAATEMQKAHALLHATDHETYSVVCAEALCCGTPVIASAVGPLPTYVGDRNGALVERNDAATWASTIAGEWDRSLGLDRGAVSEHMRDRTHPRSVGRRFEAILRSILAQAR
jgi:glycosyltransferase involved in cell wall biosynthesis